MRRAVRTIAALGFAATTSILSIAGCGFFADEQGTGAGSCEDDMNPCTIDACATGMTTHTHVANGETCSRGENDGVCVDGACALTCEAQGTPCKCASDSECPVDKQCIDWSCDMGQCKSTQSPEGQVVDTLEMGDCKSVACQNGTPQTVADANDVPADTLGDCQKPVCNNEMPATIPDDKDKPADTGCVSNSCSAGMVIPKNAVPGTACATGFCDSAGMCVNCLTEKDWKLCGSANCLAKLCTGESCGMQPNAVCQSGFCADGVCCDTACTDECKSCNVTGMVGTCSNIPYYQEDPTYVDPVTMSNLSCNVVVAGSVCNGMGKCLRIINTACNQNASCISNSCVSLKCLGAPGEACAANSQCVSMMCVMGACK